MSSLPTSLWRRKERYIREAKVEKLDYLGTSLSMAALVEKWTWTVSENFNPHEESLMYYCCGINAEAEAESGLLFPNHSTDIILVLSRVLLGLKVPIFIVNIFSEFKMSRFPALILLHWTQREFLWLTHSAMTLPAPEKSYKYGLIILADFQEALRCRGDRCVTTWPTDLSSGFVEK